MYYLIILVIVAVVFQKYTVAKGADGIHYTRKELESVVEPEEPFEIETVIENKSRRFIPFIRIVEPRPENAFTGPANRFRMTDAPVKDQYTMYLLPKQLVRRTAKTAISERGRWLITGASIYTGDFLGFSEDGIRVDTFREIIVIPRRAESVKLDIVLGGIFGDISVRRFIHEDPILTLGYREYTGREPQKHISWTQSAKSNRLMVKKFDYTTESVATVILNIDGGSNEGRESCFCIARTICEELTSRGISFRFETNVLAAGHIRMAGTIADGTGHVHLMRILELLGRATHNSGMSFDRLLSSVLQRREESREYIVITSDLPESAASMLLRLRELSGGAVYVIEGDEVI